MSLAGKSLKSLRWAVGNKKWNPEREKWDKPPMCPGTGRYLSVNKPGEWVCSREETRKIQRKRSYEYIGFLLTENDPVHVTDFDDVVDEDGNIDPRVMKIIEEQNTYAEISLSGKGVHLIGAAIKSEDQMSNFSLDGVSVESYDRKRFVVYTGRAINSEGIKDVQEWVDANVPTREKKNVRVAPNPVDATDEEIIKMASSSKNGDKFKKLFHEGDISLYGDDHSQADMALCGILAFWTGRDPERMDRIFRSSKLVRDKWDRDDYRGWTIQAAIDNSTSTYDLKGKEDLLDKLHNLRVNSQWSDKNAYLLYGAFLQIASLSNWYVPGEGIYVYASARNLNLGSNIIDPTSRDFIRVTRIWRELQKAGLIKEISKGGGNKSSLYLLLESSIDSFLPTKGNTGGNKDNIEAEMSQLQ